MLQRRVVMILDGQSRLESKAYTQRMDFHLHEVKECFAAGRSVVRPSS